MQKKMKKNNTNVRVGKMKKNKTNESNVLTEK
jgi:hypothetical protein